MVPRHTLTTGASRYMPAYEAGVERVFVSLVLTWMSCLYVLEINTLPVVSFAIIFPHSEGGLFTLFIVSFAMQ